MQNYNGERATIKAETYIGGMPIGDQRSYAEAHLRWLRVKRRGPKPKAKNVADIKAQTIRETLEIMERGEA